MNEDKTIYRRLIHDKRISHGAFRLWHYLHDRRNKCLQCWPEQRNIASEVGCKTHSLRKWTSELVQGDYLAVEKVGQNHHCKYTILFGDGKGEMPEWATRGKAHIASCSPNGEMVTPNGDTPRVAEMGNGSNPIGVITKGRGKPPPHLYLREINDLIDTAKDEIRNLKLNPINSVSGKLKPDIATTIERLKTRIIELKSQKLGVELPVVTREVAPSRSSYPSQPKETINFSPMSEANEQALLAQFHAFGERLYSHSHN